MDPEYVTITVRYNRPGDPRGPIEGTHQHRMTATELTDEQMGAARRAELMVGELFSKIADRRTS